MSSIDDKLDQCRILLDDIREVSNVQDVPRFLARFTSYANQISAVRQYAQNELTNLSLTTLDAEQVWLQDLENDVDFATIIGLRHVDQHTEAIRVGRQHIVASISETLPTQTDNAKIAALDAQGNIVSETESVPEPESPPPPPTQVSVKFNYFCNATTLPNFMTAQQGFPKGFSRLPGQGPKLKKGDDLPLKADVIEHLSNVDLFTIARRAYKALERSIRQAQANGHFT